MRMLSSEARINSSRLRSGFISQDDWMKITEAAGSLSNAPIYIDDSPDISAMEIRAKARRLKLDKKIGLIIIDYLQLMRTRSSAERYGSLRLLKRAQARNFNLLTGKVRQELVCSDWATMQNDIPLTCTRLQPSHGPAMLAEIAQIYQVAPGFL